MVISLSIKPVAAQLPDRNRAGFTLVEILIAIAVIAILTALSYPVYTGYIDKAKITRAVYSLEETRKTLEDYHITIGSYPSDINFSTGFDPQGRQVLSPMLLEGYKSSIATVDSYVLAAENYTLTVHATDTKHTQLVLATGQIITQGP